MKRLIVWRHGNTDWNAGNRVQGQTDVPLNALGREQALEAAELLVRRKPDALVSSDLRRAAETAAALGTLTGLSIEPRTSTARTGDVVRFNVRASSGQADNGSVRWTVSGPAATIDADGGFVAELPGAYVVTADSGKQEAIASMVVAPRNAERTLEVVGRAPMKDFEAAEEWIIGNYAYLSTISDKLLVYDISDPTNPKLTDTIKVDARLINDVSTTAETIRWHSGILHRPPDVDRLRRCQVDTGRDEPARLLEERATPRGLPASGGHRLRRHGAPRADVGHRGAVRVRDGVHHAERPHRFLRTKSYGRRRHGVEIFLTWRLARAFSA